MIKKWIVNLYFSIVFKWKNYKLKRLVEKEFSPTFSFNDGYKIYQNETERKYLEGIYNLKRSINSKVKSKSKDEYHKVLSNAKELISLGTVETKNQKLIRETLTSICALPEISKKEIINKRIEHYKEFHKYKEQRDLIKRIKQAKKQGDEKLALELEKEWRDNYGEIRNLRRR